jgi:hypothetical protein
MALRSVRMILVLTVLIAVLTHWDGKLLHATGEARGFAHPPFLMSEVYMIVANIGFVVAHEAGHWIAGRALGWRCLEFRIGPLALVRRPEGWRFRRMKFDAFGAVLFSPTTFDDLARSLSIHVAGGPAASILYLLLCVLIVWQSRSAGLFWLFGAMAQFAPLGVFSLAPITKGLMLSDGYKLIQLMRGGYYAARLQCYMLGNVSRGTPLRPRDWPPELIRIMTEAPASLRGRRECHLMFCHLMDAGEASAAYPWVARLAGKPEKSDPPEYALDIAFYLALHQHDPETARKWLGVAGKGAGAWMYARAQSAIAMAEGRTEEAQWLVEQGLASLATQLPCGDVDCDRDLLNSVLAVPTLG